MGSLTTVYVIMGVILVGMSICILSVIRTVKKAEDTFWLVYKDVARWQDSVHLEMKKRESHVEWLEKRIENLENEMSVKCTEEKD